MKMASPICVLLFANKSCSSNKCIFSFLLLLLLSNKEMNKNKNNNTTIN